MAAVVASKVKRQRQLHLEQKCGDQNNADSQLLQKRAASASKEAAEKKKLSQYYSQVVIKHLKTTNVSWAAAFVFRHQNIKHPTMRVHRGPLVLHDFA